MFLLWIVASSIPIAHCATGLRVRDAVAGVLSTNPSLRKAREKLQEADSQVELAFSQTFPTISATGNAAYQKDSLITNNALFGGEPYNLYGVGFRAMQPLFQGGAFFAGLGIAKTSKAIGALDVEIAERDLILRMVQAFYSVLLERKRVEIIEATVSLHKDLLATAESRLRIGRENRLDVMQIRTQLALLEPQVFKAQNQLKIAAAQVATLLSQRDRDVLEVNGSLDFRDFETLFRSLGEKKSSPPELEKMELSREQFSDQRRLVLSKHWPQLNAVANLNTAATEKTKLFDQNGKSWQLGLAFTIPLFSGLSSIFERKVLSAQENGLDADDAQLRDNLSLQQIQASSDLELSKELLHSVRVAMEVARDSSNYAKKTYKVGASNYLQLFDAYKSRLQAELDFNQANYDYLMNTAKYFVAYGWPLRKLVDSLDP